MIFKAQLTIGLKEMRELVEEHQKLRHDLALEDALFEEIFPRLNNLMKRLKSPLAYQENEKIPGNKRSDLAPEQPDGE